jgi:3-methyladenine DNA glycosylase/8-oxoguanine DNA glycosylase
VPSKAALEATQQLAIRSARLRDLIDKVGPCDLRRGRPKREHFAELARAIAYQQLAGAAARTIHGRFEALFESVAPTPEAVLAQPESALRACGLSGAKTAAIRDLAAKCLDGTVELDRLPRLPDETVVDELVRVRGIGRWTAEMFLIFQLGRMDVWPVDDLGVRKGFQRIFRRRSAPTPKELAPLGDPYKPYRSALAWYCWRAVDTITPSGA